MSANGTGPEWDAECDVGSTGPDPDGWMSDGYVPNVRGVRMHDHAHAWMHTFRQKDTRRSRILLGRDQIKRNNQAE